MVLPLSWHLQPTKYYPMSKLTTKVVSQRRDQFLASWREYASAATFAGVSLEQFEAESMKPLEVRGRMMAVRTQLGGMKLERDKADEAHREMLTAIANGNSRGPGARPGFAALPLAGIHPEE
jgi:hypothetical protein